MLVNPAPFYDRLEIVIRPVANGWLVVLPALPEPRKPTMNEIFNEHPDKYIEMMASVGKKMRAEMHEDPLLAELLEKNTDTPEDLIKNAPLIQPRYSDLKDKNVWIFKEYSEVLEFLKERVS